MRNGSLTKTATVFLKEYMTLNQFENSYKIKDCCCFTGHRSVMAMADDIKARLRVEIENLINKGVTAFLTGGALGFDTVAALSVLELKGMYPFIKLVLILPCKNQAEKWSKDEIRVYNDIIRQADFIHYVSDVYYDGCMLARNDYMVEHSNYCICFLRRLSGGTYYTVSYAKRMGRELIML